MRKVGAIIVGASLAGSSLALRLADLGIAAALVDSAEFPRRKACGEGLSAMALWELEQLNLLQATLTLEHVPYNGFSFFERDRTSALGVIEKGAAHSHGIGVSRRLLDHLLFSATAQHGVFAHAGCEYDLQRRGNDGFCLTAGTERYFAPFLVFATGSTSKLPDRFGMRKRMRKTSRCGVSIEIKSDNINAALHNTVGVHLDRKTQTCCTLTGPGKATLAIMSSTPDATLLRSKNIASLLERIQNEIGFDCRVIGNPLGSSNIGQIVRHARKGNIFTIGDARRQLDPIGGMGMTHALVSARLTAASIQKLSKGRVPFTPPQEARHSLRDLVAYTRLSYFSLVSLTGLPFLRGLKNGAVAKNIMLSMHQSESAQSPLAKLILNTIGSFS